MSSAQLVRQQSTRSSVILSEADEKVARGKEDRAGVQKKTFTKWVNSHLNKVGYKVEELYTDMRDGQNLIKLLEVISGETLAKPDKGRGRFVMVGNVNKGLKFLSTKVTLTNIGAEDITDGNPVLTLGLIWTIILRFQIQDISVDELSAKDALLLWCRKKTKGYHNVNVENFHKSFNDGLAFAALIHAHRPDLIDFHSLDPSKPLDNLKLAFDVAENKLGITSLLDPVDVAVDRPDERSIMTYVAALYHYFASMKKGDVAGQRVANIVGELAEITRMQNEYERLATELMQWIEATIVKLDNRSLPNTIDGLQNEQKGFQKYRSEEKPPKFKEKDNLEAKFFEIQTRLRALNRAMYRPPEGRMIGDISKAWAILETAEHDRQQALVEELKRLTKLEQLAGRFDKKAKIQEAWLSSMESNIDALDDVREVIALQAALKKQESLTTDIAAHEDRLRSVSIMAKELEAENYRDKDKIIERNNKIFQRWTDLEGKVKLKRTELEELLTVLIFERAAGDLVESLKAHDGVTSSAETGKDVVNAEDLLREQRDKNIEINLLAERVKLLQEQAASISAGNANGAIAAGQYDGPADNASAVLGKSKEIESMYAKLRDASEKRTQALEAAVRGLKTRENLDTELQWIKERDAAARSKDFGRDQNDTQRMIKSHATLQSTIALHEEVVVEVLSESDGATDASVKDKRAQLDAAWKALKAAADERSKGLADASKAIQFYVSADEAEAFVKETEPAVALTDVGDSEEASAAMLKRHDSVEAEIESYEFNIKALRSQAQQLIDSNHHDKARVSARLAEIESLWSGLRTHTGARKKALRAALDLHRFMRESAELSSWIADREREARDRDFALDPESLAALKRKQDALERDLESNEPRLKEINTTADRLTAEKHPQSGEVQARKAELNARWDALQKEADLKSQAIDGAAGAQELTKEMDALIAAIHDKEPAARSDDFGKDLPSVLALQKKHEGLERDVAALADKSKQLTAEVKKAAANPGSPAELLNKKSDDMNGALKNLQELVEARGRKLDEAADLQKFNNDHADAATFVGDKAAEVARTAVPSDALSTQVAIKKLEAEKGAVEVHDAKIKAVDEFGNKLIGQNHYAKDDIGHKLAALKDERAALGKALDDRRKELEDAYALQKFNGDQAEVLAWLGDKKATVQAGETAGDLAGVSKQLKKHQELKAAVDVYDERVNAVKTQGAKLVQAGHPAKADIEGKVAAVVAERVAVAAALAAREKQLEEARDLAKFNEDAAEASAWMHGRRDAAAGAELPGDVAGVQAALKKHADAEAQARTHDHKVDEIKKFGDKLVGQDHSAKDAIAARVGELGADQAALHDALAARKQQLDDQLDLLKFESDQKDAVSWLHDKKEQVAGAEVPTDAAAVEAAQRKLKDQRTATAAHDERVKAVQGAGEALVARQHPASERVQGKLAELKGEREAVAAALDARQKQLDDALALLQFNAAHGEALGWLDEMKTLMGSSEVPKDVAGAQALLREHADRKAAIEAYDGQIRAVEAQGEKLIAAGHPASAEVRAKLDQLARQRAEVQAAWDARQAQLADALALLRFEEAHRDADAFVTDRREEVAAVEIPKDVAAAEAALKHLNAIAAAVAGQGQQLDQVGTQGQSLVQAGHPSSDAVKGKVEGLAASRAALDQALAERQKAVTDARDQLKFNNDHQEATDFLADKAETLKGMEQPKDEAAARLQLKQLDDLRNAVDAHDDKIKQVKGEGEALIGAGHPNKGEIEDKLKHLADDRAAFAAALAAKERQIREAVELMDFNRDAQAAETFLKDKEGQLAHAPATDSVAAAEAALKKHQQLLSELSVEAARIKALEADADKLIKADHHDKAAIDARRQDIVKRYGALNDAAAQRQKELEGALKLQQFLADAQDFEATLKRQQGEVQDESFKDPSASMEDKRRKHDELLAELAANAVQLDKLRKQAKELADTGHPDAAKARARLEELERQAKALEEAAKNKSEELKAAGNMNDYFRGIEQFERWFREVEAALAVEDLGKDVASVQTLRKRQALIEADIAAHKPQVESTLKAAQALVDAKHFAAAEIATKKDALRARFAKLEETSKARRGKLDAALKVQELYRDVNEEGNYIAFKLVQASSSDYGKDPLSNEKLVAKHATLEDELASHEKDVLDAVDARGKALVAENHYDAANVSKRLGELQTSWKGLKEASDKRRVALLDTRDWVAFESDATDELNFIEEQRPLLLSTEVGESLSANLALLKKHDATMSDLAEHGERIQDVLVLGERLEKEKNSHADAIKALSAQLREKNAALQTAAEQRRAKLEAASKVHQFNRAAGTIEAFLNANEVKAASTEYGKDLATVAAQLRAISDLDSASDSVRATVYDMQKSKDNVVASKHTESEAVSKRHDALQARWEAFLKNLKSRRGKIAELEASLRAADDLCLQFAEKAALLNNWIDNTEEDLSESVTVDSIEEAQALQAAHVSFQETLSTPMNDYNALVALSGEIKSKGVTSNPYTPFTIAAITEKWNHVLDLIEDRTELLNKEAERQQNNDVLRKQFADKAVAFSKSLAEIRVFLVEKNSGDLEQQLKNIQGKRKEIQGKAGELKGLEDLSVQMEKSLILDNRFTELTAVGLSQAWEGLDQLAKNLEHNVEQQIQAAQRLGVDEKDLKEWKETFDHFDRDRSSSLDYTEFKSCLRALGYDLPIVAEGLRDEQFEAIVSFVDPNRDGQIKFDEFMSFMINQRTTKVESSDEIIDALQMISEGKDYVTLEQLRAVLSPAQVEYCQQVMKPMAGTTDRYNYREFASTLFSDNAMPPTPTSAVRVVTADEIAAQRAKRMAEYQTQRDGKRGQGEAARKKEEERTASEKGKREAERVASQKAQRAADEKRKAMEAARAQREEEVRQKRDAEAKRLREEEEQRRAKEDEDKKRVEEQRRKRAADERARREAEAQQQRVQEREARMAEEAKRKAAKEDKERQDGERRAQEAEERRVREQAEADRLREQVEAAARAEAEERARIEAEQQARLDKARADAEAKIKAETDAKQKAEDEVKAKAAADAKAKADADAKAKADAEAKIKAEADEKAKAEADAKAKTDAEANAKANASVQINIAPIAAAPAKAPAAAAEEDEEDDDEEEEETLDTPADAVPRAEAAAAMASPATSQAPAKQQVASAELTAEQIIGLTCVAVTDKMATEPSELMFLDGDKITVTAILDAGRFRGECQHVSGIFSGDEVKIPDGRLLSEVSKTASAAVAATAPAVVASAAPAKPAETSTDKPAMLAAPAAAATLSPGKTPSIEGDKKDEESELKRRKSTLGSIFGRKEKTPEEKAAKAARKEEEARKKAEEEARKEEEKRKKAEEEARKKEEEKKKKEEKRRSKAA